MKVSKEVSARHREDLLNAASRLFREKGFDKVGIAEIAAAAGLTHGAFYTHFASKEALCAEAIALAQRGNSRLRERAADWPSHVESYLSPAHVRDRGRGCVFAALGSDVPRESAPLRRAYSEALDRSIETVAAKTDRQGNPLERENAIASLAAMVGGLILARAAASPALSDEILAAVKARLLQEDAG